MQTKQLMTKSQVRELWRLLCNIQTYVDSVTCVDNEWAKHCAGRALEEIRSARALLPHCAVHRSLREVLGESAYLDLRFWADNNPEAEEVLARIARGAIDPVECD